MAWTLIIPVVVAAQPMTIATPGLRVSGLDQALASFHTEHLATQLATRQMKLITPRDIEAVLGLERQRQLLGCGDLATSCLAELGAALGADAVLTGDEFRVGSAVQVNLKVLRATNSDVLAVFSERAPSVDAVADVLTRAAERFAEEVPAKLGRAVAAKPKGRPWVWGVLIGGGVVTGAGVLGLVVANVQAGRLRAGAPALTFREREQVVSAGKTAETLGWVGVAVGSAALATSLILAFVPGASADAVTLMIAPTPSSATVMLSVMWP